MAVTRGMNEVRLVVTRAVVLWMLLYCGAAAGQLLGNDDMKKLEDFLNIPDEISTTKYEWGGRGDGEQYNDYLTYAPEEIQSTTEATSTTTVGDSYEDLQDVFSSPTFGPWSSADHKFSTVNREVQIICMDKDEIGQRDAVRVELNAVSNCKDMKTKVESVMWHLCSEGCNLEFHQKKDSNQMFVIGESVDGNAQNMATKFHKPEIKRKLGVKEAVPHWGKRAPIVLVSLLVTGLLLAALLIAGYVLKSRRGHKAKAMRLADDSFQVDEQTQGNTLLSVAPLQSQEALPQDKPSINGESPDGGKGPQPPTNGHKAPVADTEL